MRAVRSSVSAVSPEDECVYVPGLQRFSLGRGGTHGGSQGNSVAMYKSYGQKHGHRKSNNHPFFLSGLDCPVHPLATAILNVSGGVIVGQINLRLSCCEHVYSAHPQHKTSSLDAPPTMHCRRQQYHRHLHSALITFQVRRRRRRKAASPAAYLRSAKLSSADIGSRSQAHGQCLI